MYHRASSRHQCRKISSNLERGRTCHARQRTTCGRRDGVRLSPSAHIIVTSVKHQHHSPAHNRRSSPRQTPFSIHFNDGISHAVLSYLIPKYEALPHHRNHMASIMAPLWAPLRGNSASSSDSSSADDQDDIDIKQEPLSTPSPHDSDAMNEDDSPEEPNIMHSTSRDYDSDSDLSSLDDTPEPPSQEMRMLEYRHNARNIPLCTHTDRCICPTHASIDAPGEVRARFPYFGFHALNADQHPESAERSTIRGEAMASLRDRVREAVPWVEGILPYLHPSVQYRYATDADLDRFQSEARRLVYRINAA